MPILRYQDVQQASTDNIWNTWKNFTPDEVACKGTGKIVVETNVLDALQKIRDALGKPIRISSFYRAPEYNETVSSTRRNGPHTTGLAFDIRCFGDDAVKILYYGLQLGASGVGVQQKGEHDRRFIHLDWCKRTSTMPRPWTWSY